MYYLPGPTYLFFCFSTFSQPEARCWAALWDAADNGATSHSLALPWMTESLLIASETDSRLRSPQSDVGICMYDFITPTYFRLTLLLLLLIFTCASCAKNLWLTARSKVNMQQHTRNCLTVCNQLSSGSFKNNHTNKPFVYKSHTHTHTHTHTCIYEGESKSKAFSFSTGKIRDTGTCIIHQNKASPLWITCLLFNVINISLKRNIVLSNESMYPCLVKFCWLFFLVDFLRRVKTINSEAHIKTLTRLMTRIWQVKPKLPIDNLLLDHKTWPHKSIGTSFGWPNFQPPP